MLRRGRREDWFSMALGVGRTGMEGAGTGRTGALEAGTGSTGAVEAGTRGLR